MPSNTPSWERMGAFLAVMRHGSLSKAAEVLGVTHPTVRRRIEGLEKDVGRVLFLRSANVVLPTDAARRMLPAAETMEAAARSLLRAASGPKDALEGTVRVAASVLLGAEVLPELLVDLRRRHPGIQVELALSNSVADLGRRDADIAVRMAPLAGESLVARRIGAIAFGFFAAPSYLEHHPAPASLDELRDHDLVGYDAGPQLVEGLAALGLELHPRDFAFRTDHDLAYLAALRAGAGIGVTQMPLASEPPLVRLLPEVTLPVDLWLVTHRDLRHVRRIRATLDALADGLRPYTSV